MTPTSHDVLLVCFPHQLLHAMAALHEERRLRGDARALPVTVIVWCYEVEQHRSHAPFRRLFSTFASAFPEVRLVFPSYIQRVTRLSALRPVRDRVAAMQQLAGQAQVRIFGYAHDVSADHTAQVGLQAWPAAFALCFGDAPGFLYMQDEIRASISPSSPMRWLAAGGRQPDAGLRWRYAQRNRVALALSAVSETQGETHIVPTDVLRRHLARMTHALGTPHADEQRRILDARAAPSLHMLLLSNFTESGMTQRDDELALYVQLIDRFVSPGGHILIKPHPGTQPGFLARIAATAARHRVEALPETLARLPVETLDVLIPYCRIVSVSSSSALLAKLYGQQTVLHGLSEDMIDSLFVPKWRSHMRAANQAIAASLQSKPK